MLIVEFTLTKTRGNKTMSNEIKQNIIRDLQGDVLSGDHYTINMFSCWLDGSYLGEPHYRKNLAAITECNNNRKKLRSFVINAFTSYIARCSLFIWIRAKSIS